MNDIASSIEQMVRFTSHAIVLDDSDRPGFWKTSGRALGIAFSIAHALEEAGQESEAIQDLLEMGVQHGKFRAARARAEDIRAGRRSS